LTVRSAAGIRRALRPACGPGQDVERASGDGTGRRLRPGRGVITFSLIQSGREERTNGANADNYGDGGDGAAEGAVADENLCRLRPAV
jgi:hypothetical protein